MIVINFNKMNCVSYIHKLLESWDNDRWEKKLMNKLWETQQLITLQGFSQEALKVRGIS